MSLIKFTYFSVVTLKLDSIFDVVLRGKIFDTILSVHSICTVVMVSSPIYSHVSLSIIILYWLGPEWRPFTIPQHCLAGVTCQVGSWLLETHQLRRCSNFRTRFCLPSWDWHSCLPMSGMAVELTFLCYSLAATHSIDLLGGCQRRSSWFTWRWLVGLFESGKNI